MEGRAYANSLGVSVQIYTNEPANERPHIHIIKDDRDAKIWIDELAFAKGADLFKAKEVREIMGRNSWWKGLEL